LIEPLAPGNLAAPIHPNGSDPSNKQAMVGAANALVAAVK
jgi:hypothetical protein